MNVRIQWRQARKKTREIKSIILHLIGCVGSARFLNQSCGVTKQTQSNPELFWTWNWKLLLSRLSHYRKLRFVCVVLNNSTTTPSFRRNPKSAINVKMRRWTLQVSSQVTNQPFFSMLSISRYHQCPSLFSKLNSAMSVTPAKTTFPSPLLLLRAPLAIGSNGLRWSVYILSLRNHRTFKKFMKYWFGGFGWNKQERINLNRSFFGGVSNIFQRSPVVPQLLGGVDMQKWHTTSQFG